MRVRFLHGVPVFRNGPVAQLGERLNGIQQVAGSMPVCVHQFSKSCIERKKFFERMSVRGYNEYVRRMSHTMISEI